MTNLLVFIFLGSLVGVLVGLIKPGIMLPIQPSRQMVACVYGGVAIASFVLIALTAPQPPEAEQPPLQQEAIAPSPTPSASIATPTAASPIETPVPEPSSPSIARNGAGLGDTSQSIAAIHGQNAGINDFGRYQNDYLHIIYMEDRAYTVSLLLGNAPRADRSPSEAVLEAQPFLPDDAVKVKEWQEDVGVFVIHYESKKLASAYTEDATKQIWLDDGIKPGTFVLVVESDPENLNSAMAVTISPGNPENI